MTNQEMIGHLDHTLLKQTVTWQDIKKLCEEAVEYKVASVCIPPSYVEAVRGAFPGLRITTVIGFPNGYSTTETKVFETRDVIEKGADEIDMVVCVADVKSGAWDKVEKEIKAIRTASKGKILKVIIEACFLTDEEKVRLCRIVTDAGADYIKTSTGFGKGGATHHDILLFKEHIGSHVRMKAAGGIHTYEDLKQFIDEGCDRIGTTSGLGYILEKMK